MLPQDLTKKSKELARIRALGRRRETGRVRPPPASPSPGHPEARIGRAGVVTVGEALVHVEAELTALAEVPSEGQARGGRPAREADAVDGGPLCDAGIACRKHLAPGREGVLPTQFAVQAELARRGEPGSPGAQAEAGLPTRRSLAVGTEAEAFPARFLEPGAADACELHVGVWRERERARLRAIAHFAISDVVMAGVVAAGELGLVAKAQQALHVAAEAAEAEAPDAVPVGSA